MHQTDNKGLLINYRIILYIADKKDGYRQQNVRQFLQSA